MDVYQAFPLLVLLRLLFEILKVEFNILDVVVILGPRKSENLFETVVYTRLVVFGRLLWSRLLDFFGFCVLSFLFERILLLLTSDEL